MAITQDSPFTYTELEQRINSDLAHDLGNLLNRTITLALKYKVAVITPPQAWSAESTDLYQAGKNIITRYMQEMEAGYMNRAYARVWEYVHRVNKYFHNQQPWKLVRYDEPLHQQIRQNFQKLFQQHATHYILSRICLGH